jgi:hypothetical protein
MMYTSIGATMTSAGMDIATRIEHGRSLNPFTDAGARMDFINLVPMGAAGAAKAFGSKLFTRAVTALTRTPKVASVLTSGAKATALVTGIGGAGEAFVEAGIDLYHGNSKQAGEQFKAGLTNVALMAAGGLKERAVTGAIRTSGRAVVAHDSNGQTVAVDSATLGTLLNRGDAPSLAIGRTRATLDGEAVKVSPNGTLTVGDKVLTYENKPIRVLDYKNSKQMPPGESVVLGEDGTLSVVTVGGKEWTNGTRVPSGHDGARCSPSASSPAVFWPSARGPRRSVCTREPRCMPRASRCCTPRCSRPSSTPRQSRNGATPSGHSRCSSIFPKGSAH